MLESGKESRSQVDSFASSCDQGRLGAPNLSRGAQQGLSGLGIEGRERGAAVEKSCLETSSHLTSLLSFPFPLSPPPPLNPTFQIHKLQILQPCLQQQQHHGAVQRGKKGTAMSKNTPGSAGSLECPAMGEKNNWEHFSRTRLASVSVYTGSTGTKSIYEGEPSSSSFYVLAVQGCYAFVLWTFAL